MKIGICTDVTNMEKALAAGADYIEVGNMKLAAMSDEEFEAAAAIAIYDLILSNTQTSRRK